MRTLTIRATVVAAALVLLASGSAQAAVQQFAVPFPFIVSGKSLPAGAYRLAGRAVSGPTLGRTNRSAQRVAVV